MLKARPVWLGFLGFAGLLAVYFGLLTLLSGWELAKDQFAAYWYFVLLLAAGFGLQVGLYTSLRSLVHHGARGKLVAASGTTSTAAMVSCCTHYLANFAPIIGATGLVTLAARYQVEIFWAGLVFNGAGVALIATQLVNARKEQLKCATA